MDQGTDTRTAWARATAQGVCASAIEAYNRAIEEKARRTYEHTVDGIEELAARMGGKVTGPNTITLPVEPQMPFRDMPLFGDAGSNIVRVLTDTLARGRIPVHRPSKHARARRAA